MKFQLVLFFALISIFAAAQGLHLSHHLKHHAKHAAVGGALVGGKKLALVGAGAGLIGKKLLIKKAVIGGALLLPKLLVAKALLLPKILIAKALLAPKILIGAHLAKKAAIGGVALIGAKKLIKKIYHKKHSCAGACHTAPCARNVERESAERSSTSSRETVREESASTKTE